MQQMRVDVNNGSVFYADEAGIIHNPLKFVFDFVSTTPRNDMASQPMRLVMEHRVVIMEPFKAKEFLKALQENITKYEKNFGKIETPKALQKSKKMRKKSGRKDTPTKVDYFG